MLIRRPHHLAGESWSSFLRVCAHANGYASGRHLQFAVMGDKLLLRCEVEKAMTLFGYDSPPDDFLHFRQANARSIRGMRNDVSRICAICLSERRHRLPSVWDLPLSITCDLHSVNLMEECPQCRSKLNAMRPLSRFCQCGFDLADSPTTQPEEWSRTLQRLAGIASISHRDATFAWPTAEEQFASQVLGLIDRCLNKDSVATRKTLWPDLRQIRSNKSWLHPWPTALADLMTNFLATRWQVRFRLLKAAQKLSYPEVSQVMQECLSLAVRPVRPKPRKQVTWGGGAYVGNVEQIARELDVARLTLNKWVRAVLRHRGIGMGDPHRFGQRFEIMQWLLTECGRALTFQQAADLYGASGLLLAGLGDAGEFKLGSLHVPTAKVFTAKLDMLVSEMRLCSSVVEESDGTFISFSDALGTWRGRQQQLATTRALLRMIRDKSIAVLCLANSDPQRLDGLGFNRLTLLELRLIRRKHRRADAAPCAVLASQAQQPAPTDL